MVASKQVDAISMENQILVNHAVLTSALIEHLVLQSSDSCARASSRLGTVGNPIGRCVQDWVISQLLHLDHLVTVVPMLAVWEHHLVVIVEEIAEDIHSIFLLLLVGVVVVVLVKPAILALEASVYEWTKHNNDEANNHANKTRQANDAKNEVLHLIIAVFSGITAVTSVGA